VARHTFVRRSVLAVFIAVTIATLWPIDALAQRAVPRPSGRSAVVARPYYRPYYYRPYYGYPYYPYYPYYGYYWPSFYAGFYGFYGGFYGPYGQYPYPYYGGYYYDNSGSARLQISPRNAQVYVDGYFAGLVDNFDGNLQRLNVESGEHELQFFLEGYRAFSLKVLFVRGRTVKITHAMEPLAPGEAPAVPPKPDPATRQQLQAQPYGNVEARPRQMPPPRQGQPSEFGSLLLRVRPADASVTVDGEQWTAPQGEDQFVIELAEGPHRIEVRKDGYQAYSTMVRVRRGETVRLNVSLATGGSISGS
jgi:PEGA domain